MLAIRHLPFAALNSTAPVIHGTHLESTLLVPVQAPRARGGCVSRGVATSQGVAPNSRPTAFVTAGELGATSGHIALHVEVESSRAAAHARIGVQRLLGCEATGAVSWCKRNSWRLKLRHVRVGPRLSSFGCLLWRLRYIAGAPFNPQPGDCRD